MRCVYFFALPFLLLVPHLTKCVNTLISVVGKCFQKGGDALIMVKSYRSRFQWPVR